MFNKIKEVMVETLNIEESEIKLESRLVEDLGLDSLASVELALELETEFDIKIEDSELEKLVIVEDIVKIIESKTK